MQWNDLTRFHQVARSRTYVLVTMVTKRGSSYRQPGARMLVRDDGAFSGSVSAGCLEDEIARAAAPVRADGVARLLTIDTRPHYGCPGQITLLMEPLHTDAGDALFDAVGAKLRAREPFSIATDHRDLTRRDPLTRMIREEDPEEAEAGVLIQRVDRRPRLVVVGTGDDATAVAKVALLAGWDVQAVGSMDIQFAPARLATLFPPDDRTAVILMTHNLGLDVACLHRILPLPYSYIGVIGSSRRRSELIENLETTGDPAVLASLDRLFCPAGLDLGATESGEIALSILAEVQCLWSGRDAGSLRERGRPIHHGEQTA